MGKSISAAEYVDDVNKDSVVIVDGLTKVMISKVTFVASDVTCCL